MNCTLASNSWTAPISHCTKLRPTATLILKLKTVKPKCTPSCCHRQHVFGRCWPTSPPPRSRTQGAALHGPRKKPTQSSCAPRGVVSSLELGGSGSHEAATFGQSSVPSVPLPLSPLVRPACRLAFVAPHVRPYDERSSRLRAASCRGGLLSGCSLRSICISTLDR